MKLRQAVGFRKGICGRSSCLRQCCRRCRRCSRCSRCRRQFRSLCRRQCLHQCRCQYRLAEKNSGNRKEVFSKSTNYTKGKAMKTKEEREAAVANMRVAIDAWVREGVIVRIVKCPFCGSPGEVGNNSRPGEPWFAVYCSAPRGKCDLNPHTGWRRSCEEAVCAWNKRR